MPQELTCADNADRCGHPQSQTRRRRTEADRRQRHVFAAETGWQSVHTGLDLHEGLTISRETSRLLLVHDVAGADAAVDHLVSL